LPGIGDIIFPKMGGDPLRQNEWEQFLDDLHNNPNRGWGNRQRSNQ